jgi:RNA polymerase sigma factor (sigma-70 family)
MEASPDVRSKPIGGRVRHKEEMKHDNTSAFCAEVSAPLVGALTLYCGNRAVAEELAQEALVRAFQRWAAIESPRAWTYAVAFNLARSTFRRQAAERRAHDRAAQLSGDGSVDPDTTSAIAVRQAVAALAPRQRQVVACRFYAQLTVAESAAVMGCAEGTVKALTSQAIAVLRRAGLAVDEPDAGGGSGTEEEVGSDA